MSIINRMATVPMLDRSSIVLKDYCYQCRYVQTKLVSARCIRCHKIVSCCENCSDEAQCGCSLAYSR